MKIDRIVWNVLKYSSLAVCLAFAPFIIWKQFENEEWARYWWLILGPALGVLLLLVWYAVFANAPAKTRVLRSFWTFTSLVVVTAVLKVFFVYDGSSGGSSLPSFRFRFAEEAIDSEIKPEVDPAAVGDLAPAEGVVDSPQFLGPNRDGHFPDAEVSLNFAKNPPEEIWRKPIGKGWSSFSVKGARALTQEQHGDDEWVSCYELSTGRLLWKYSDEGTRFTTSVDEDARTMAVMGGEGPRGTPTIHGEDVFTMGSTGVLNCLDLATGKLRWSRNVLTEFSAGLPRWGKSSAPLVIDEPGIVVVTAVEGRGPTLLAYNTDTGEPVWEYEGRGASYSSPRLMEIMGEPQIVAVNGFDVTGHEPDTGVELWKFDWPQENPKVGQPLLVGEDRLLVSASYNMGTYLLQLRSDEGIWSVEPVWKTIKLKTKFSSALIKDGFAYGLNEGRFACIDLENGKQQWRGESYGFGQNLLVGDRILVQAEKGDIAVVEANPSVFIETARIDDALEGMTWNTPTLAGQYLLVRNGTEAICYRLAAK